MPVLEQPVGLIQRVYTLDPRGNNEEAEAARIALYQYAGALAKSCHPRLRQKSVEITRWLNAEEAQAHAVKIGQEICGSVY